MVNLIDNREKFLKKYRIKEEEFEDTGLDWSTLKEIYDDYLGSFNLLKSTGETIAGILRTHPNVHSVRMRIKDPEHLIEKLIRKSKNKEFSFNINDYKEKITDLIGLRVLHLSKGDAYLIDPFIKKNWDLHEPVTIYYRKGDFSKEDIATEELEDIQNFVLKEHPAGYRSWHYLIETNLTKERYIAEIQVRTIFEEGWSEIDHWLRYPYNLDDEILNNQLMVLNRLAGSADEMVNSIIETVEQLNKLSEENEKSKNEIFQLRKKIQEMDVEQKEKDSLIESLDKIEDKTVSVSSSGSMNKCAPYISPTPSSIASMVSRYQNQVPSSIASMVSRYQNQVPSSIASMVSRYQNQVPSSIATMVRGLHNPVAGTIINDTKLSSDPNKLSNENETNQKVKEEE
ncbi:MULTISPECIES: hypothetical protein [Bacillus]|uniref:hypothetical protein n=1 Tax=Bacillus TaxID=1386 RepID=UPI001CDD8FC0|nr:MULTISPECIES: hypothetical protein [Bacillus]MED3669602.1 hypothetical protein [Bacillus subtilis]UQZ56475.1 hypothetical protein C2H96_19280 [Bacillus subtilis]UQZ65148.1 hypothetical protein C2H97_01020 [Bacillus subtilis PY79]UQZ69574.1 hypothetical protein C2I05_03005 [Bacillus subtilis]